MYSRSPSVKTLIDLAVNVLNICHTKHTQQNIKNGFLYILLLSHNMERFSDLIYTVNLL